MKETTRPLASEQDFPIVGIGASAGGLEAFKQLLTAIPENSGMAYVLVQHLDPRYESILPDILSKVTKLPVYEITDEIHLAPDSIYVIPSNKILTTFDGVLKLTPRETKTNAAIDVFFASLAEIHQDLAVGVVLSGTGTDGTEGLKAIKKYGGITIAQEPESAAYEGMPQSAADAQVVDFILPPDKIPEKLIELSKRYKSEDGILKDDTRAFKKIINLLQETSNVDFTFYKQTTVKRRVARRVMMSKAESLSAYLKILETDKDEQAALFQDMLIPVTSFFRDPKVFQELTETIFPLIFENKPDDEPIRIWSAGCSTGEEAFSLAIALSEFLGGKLRGKQIQIFGSDISEKAILKARRAIFSEKEVELLGAAYLEKYFTKRNENFELNKSIRDICVFAVQNFLKDPPFSKMDLITCRNSLIYMETFLQKKALTNFHYALNKSGYLILGKSETAAAASDLFTDFNKRCKIYSPNIVKDRFLSGDSERPFAGLRQKKQIAQSQQDIAQIDFRKSADAILLSKYTPASVIMNEQMDIVHIQGEIDAFIELSQGKPTFNIIKMARAGLGFELRNAIHKAKATKSFVGVHPIPIKSNGEIFNVTIEITPLTKTVEPYYLVVFRKVETAKKLVLVEDGVVSIDSENELHIEQLEKELLQNREDMRSITEDQESANEELQSSNEELLSGSEELQSLNEELESSKEELQSTNEELMSINQEFIKNQEQLNISQRYTEAIIATLREPLVVLDKSLRVKTANSSFYTKFNIFEDDVEGKLIYEIKNKIFDNAVLRSLLEKILPERTQMNDYEIPFRLSTTGDRVMLLNARKIISKKVGEELILLSFEDISDRRAAEKLKNRFLDELEKQVKQRTLQLEQSNTQLEQFAHTTSHEFQEPLRKIVVFARLLRDRVKDIKPQVVEQYLAKIEAASVRMTALIEDMLDFASATNYEKLLVKTDLNSILKDVLFDFELLIKDKNAKIIVHDLPTIEAVPFQMNQLVYDLIDNSLKFSQIDKAPVIDVSSRKLTAEELKSYPNLNQKNEYYEIVFKDNGIGFNQKYAGKIFMMFQRLSHGGSYPGMGIGLAICKKTVEQYQGEIFAEGKENDGAVFRVILPVKQNVK